MKLIFQAQQVAARLKKLPQLSRRDSFVRFSGTARGESGIRIVYQGRASSLSEFVAMLSSPPCSEGCTHGSAAWHAREARSLESGPHDADVAIIDTVGGLMPAPKGAFLFQPFVRAILPLAGNIEEQLDRSGRSYRQQVARVPEMSLRWRESKSDRDLDLFYDSMYVPYSRARHGDRVHIQTREEMARQIARGGFLQIVEGEDRPLAGSIFYRSRTTPDTLFWWRNGVALNDDDPGLPGRMNHALDYAAMSYALQHRDTYKKLDVGLSPALLADGTWIRKRRMGCDFAPVDHAPKFWLSIAPGRERAVLEAMPVLAHGPNGLEGHVFAECDGSPKAVKRALGAVRDVSFPALSAVWLRTPASCHEAISEALAPTRHETPHVHLLAAG